MASVDIRSRVEGEIIQAFGIVPAWAKSIPDAAVEGFWRTMSDFQLAETRIPNKYKELIGLGVSGATRCRYCQLFHAEAARLFGATEEEIAEAAMMAAHTMSASTFLNSMGVDYEEFKNETLQIVDYVKKAQAGQAVQAPKAPLPRAPEVGSELAH
jgi:AhpD family alkylhydroperoxidase